MGSLARGLPEPKLPIRIAPSMVPGTVVPDGTIVALMVAHIATLRPRTAAGITGSDILRELRAAFPECPLSLRVAALNVSRQ